MFNKTVDAFARVRLGFVAAAAAAALGVILAFASFTGTPIAELGRAIDFSDPEMAVGAALVVVLLLAVVACGVAISTHSTNRFAR